MGWFKRAWNNIKKVLQRKEGGSVVGNILRNYLDTFTLGVYSTVNPVLPCSSGRYTQGSLGFSIDNSCHGVNGHVNLYRGGLTFGNPFNFNQNSWSGHGINGNSPLSTNGTIPVSTGNLLNLPDEVITIGNTVLNALNIGEIDLNDVDESLVNILDNAFGNEAPPEIQQAFGIGANGLPNTSHGWDFNGTAGGVSISVSGGNDEPQPVKDPWYKKTWKSITDFSKTTLGILTFVSIPLIVLGYIVYKKFFKKAKR